MKSEKVFEEKDGKQIDETRFYVLLRLKLKRKGKSIKYSHPLIFFTLCHISATSFSVLGFHFMEK